MPDTSPATTRSKKTRQPAPVAGPGPSRAAAETGEPGWWRRTRRSDGRGGALGVAMPMKAGRLLGRLRTLGLICRHGRGWAPTPAGRQHVTAATPDPSLGTSEPGPETFLDAYRTGTASAGRIDDWIDRWHDTPGPQEQSLHEFLGLTWEQYQRWAVTGELPAAPAGA